MAEKSTRSGIQLLLKAEKSATEIVSEARKRKNIRLKQAKDEAKAEVDGYKAERESQYQKKERDIMGTKGNEESKVNLQTDLHLQEMEKMLHQNNEKAMARLLSLIVDVEIEQHKNLKLQQQQHEGTLDGTVIN